MRMSKPSLHELASTPGCLVSSLALRLRYLEIALVESSLVLGAGQADLAPIFHADQFEGVEVGYWCAHLVDPEIGLVVVPRPRFH